MWTVLQARQSFFNPYTPAAYITDFLLQCGSILLVTTFYADSPVVLNGLLMLPAIAAYFNEPAAAPKKQSKPGKDSDDKDLFPEGLDPFPQKPFITHYRGCMMIITCICILAVDFEVFPRRFAKVENWGTSLMDLGVGSFVFSAGVISVRQQLKNPDAGFADFPNRMNKALRHSLPLLAMGFIRLYSVKGLDYQEHVSEYGVHWNFFFTLGLLPPVVALFQDLLRLIPSYSILGFAVAVIYQMFFTYTDLIEYIFTAARIDFLSQNREGIFSFFGYLAIFLTGQGIGQCILPRDEELFKRPLSEEDEWLSSVLAPGQEMPRSPIVDRSITLPSIIQLVKWSAIWCITYYFSTGYYGPRLTVSRRLANEPYVVWVAAFNCCQLTLYCLIENFVWPRLYKSKDAASEKDKLSKATSKVLNAFNRNGLVIFLLANLLTGLINMTMDTLHMGDIAATAVIGAYIGVLAGVGLLLDHYDISIKL